MIVPAQLAKIAVMIAAMVEGRNITTRDRTVTIMEARADQTIVDVRVQMTLRMTAPMESLVQRTAVPIPSLQVTAQRVDQIAVPAAPKAGPRVTAAGPRVTAV